MGAVGRARRSRRCQKGVAGSGERGKGGLGCENCALSWGEGRLQPALMRGPVDCCCVWRPRCGRGSASRVPSCWPPHPFAPCGNLPVCFSSVCCVRLSQAPALLLLPVRRRGPHLACVAGLGRCDDRGGGQRRGWFPAAAATWRVWPRVVVCRRFRRPLWARSRECFVCLVRASFRGARADGEGLGGLAACAGGDGRAREVSACRGRQRRGADGHGSCARCSPYPPQTQAQVPVTVTMRALAPPQGQESRQPAGPPRSGRAVAFRALFPGWQEAPRRPDSGARATVRRPWDGGVGASFCWFGAMEGALLGPT